MAKWLVVSKDNGDTKMLLPISRAAIELGHKVRIMAEGVGVLYYKTAGIKPYFSDNNADPDPKTSFDAEALLEDVNPQVVLVGFPGPTNLSRTIALAANKMGIPVVGVEDYWGGAKRNPEIKCALVLTIDEYSAEIARGCVGAEARVAVIGNHAIPGPEYKSPEAVLIGIKELRTQFEEIFVYGGGGALHTTEELKLLVPSLQKTHGNWCLIPRYHPNEKKKTAEEIGNKRIFVEVWDEILLPLDNRVRRLDAGNSDDMAVVCDAYFSSIGSSMNTAISCGKPTVAVVTPVMTDVLRTARLEAIPAVSLGGAKTLTEVMDIRPLLVRPDQAIMEKFRPLDAKLAVREIENFLANFKAQ
ncbi:hypothetical protein A2834_03420 [Candidatus Giovannonibacteria bacterium RIFCSPHIGHO2_01_FULL_45_23]|uniref:Uncharacterized protein n=1 Tax=Candidatus Giovannonibacteria bacterium RIFCSPHIGHO2_01_FULL_45_23 TaxID=1798325 RepID=A0A1F5VGB0_9BACT|nr:MAG: hypothetical protein A2834_03420 [Candidatus Giovannonibacteria bacterium RIFCSPHIGHO2_01_FULL_45_23]